MRFISFSPWFLIVLSLLSGLSCLVFVPQAHSAMPSAFSLVSPANGATISTEEILDWEDSKDGDNEVTYRVLISTDINIPGDNRIPISGDDRIKSSICLVTEEDGIEDNSTYYWQVEATSKEGFQTQKSEVWQFHTENPAIQPSSAWVGGFIRNANAQSEPVANVTVTFRVWKIPFSFISDANGYFIGKILHNGPDPPNAGTVEPAQVEISTEGYILQGDATTTITMGDDVNRDFTLEMTTIRGDILSDHDVNLADAILLFQILTTKQTASDPDKEADVDGDEKLGMADLVYVLGKIADTSGEQ